MNQAIVIKSHFAGIGSIFNSTILGIEQIKRQYQNCFPIVIWDSTPYGEGNIFNKYFNIIGFDISSNYNIISTMSGIGFENNRKNYRHILHDIYSTHIEVKPIIKNKVDSIFLNVSYDHLFGIHFRNTDRCTCPQYASPGVDKVSKRMLEVLNNYNNKHIAIYIASDNIPDVDYFKKYIEDNHNDINNILFIEDSDATRSPNHISVHGTDDEGISYFTPDQKALSILTDIFALARCELLVRTCSNVTCSSGIINKESKIIDISLEYGKFTENWLSE